VLTVAGAVRLSRLYLRCSTCRVGGFPLDEHLGVQGMLSRRAQRLLCLAGASWSFDRASEHLQELCGLQVSDTTIREVCQPHGAAGRRWQQDDATASRAFREAPGETEFSTDGTSVNTTAGWREMRVGVFAKRERGQPLRLPQWRERTLPKPTARVAHAGLVRSAAWGGQWRRWAARLGIQQTAELTVLADGARWIWKQAAQQFPDAQGVLDIYHVSAHLHQTAAVLHGEGSEAARRWVEQRRQCLLQGGAAALLDELAGERRQTRSQRKRASLLALADYVAPHVDHTPYRERLARGQTIGSGLVEGACKTVIGRRLKQTGARWRVRRVERMANLCCLLYSDQWNTYWTAKAA